MKINSDSNEELFRNSLKEEAEELSASAFGGTLLYTIGLSYRSPLDSLFSCLLPDLPLSPISLTLTLSFLFNPVCLFVCLSLSISYRDSLFVSFFAISPASLSPIILILIFSLSIILTHTLILILHLSVSAPPSQRHSHTHSHSFFSPLVSEAARQELDTFDGLSVGIRQTGRGIATRYNIAAAGLRAASLVSDYE